MSVPLVKINIDSADEIARLYDIGPKLAERIVRYRGTQGYLHNPEELAQVEGVSKALAITLAPHIDWQVPEETESPKAREWGSAFLLTALVFATVWLTVKRVLPSLPSLHSALLDYRSGYIEAGVGIWIVFSIIAAEFFIALSLSASAIRALTQDSAKAQWLARVSILLWIPATLGVISCGIGNAVYYQCVSPQGWTSLLGDFPALAAIGEFVFVVLLMMPQVMLLWHPALAYNPNLARVYDAGVVLGAPVSAWVIATNFGEWPLWIIILQGMMGLLFGSVGLLTLRTGASFFQQAIDRLNLAEIARREAETSRWLTWINARLPQPEQQKALKQALNEAYPPSKVRTVAGFVVFVAGGWLLMTALGAIVEWVIQGWLNQVVPWLK